MKYFPRYFLCLLGALALSPSQANAENRWGLGAILGDPVALTAKHEWSPERALDLGFGYSWGHSVLFYGDYLFQFPNSFSSDSQFVNELIPYVGVGPQLEIYSSSHKKRIGDSLEEAVFSARIPGGLAWNIPDSPVQLFLEVAPVLNLIPGLELDIQAGIGGRFFF